MHIADFEVDIGTKICPEVVVMESSNNGPKPDYHDKDSRPITIRHRSGEKSNQKHGECNKQQDFEAFRGPFEMMRQAKCNFQEDEQTGLGGRL